jgi:hypothetical protein
MEEEYNRQLKEDRASVNANSVWLSQEKYNELINKVLSARIKGKKDPSDYRVLKTYSVLEVDGSKKLIVPPTDGSDVKYYAHDGELYEILDKIHTAVGHGGRDRTMREVRKTYKNITYKDIMLFLSLCETCQPRQKKEKKGDGKILIY